MSSCQSCGKPIFWVDLPSGKRMPCDTESVSMVVVSADGKKGQVRRVHASHFATCDRPALFRKRKA